MNSSFPRLQRSGSVLLEHHGPAQVYKPPVIRSRFEAEVPPPIVAGMNLPHNTSDYPCLLDLPLPFPDALSINDFPKGEVRTAWINMVRSPLGEWIRVPVLVARGVEVCW